jgi:NADPH2:quinone reductase
MKTMQAIQITEFGGPEVLVVRELEQPRAQAGEVVVKLDYAGVSFADTYMRRGYYKPPHTYATKLPFTPGIDGVGHIVEIGDGVTGFSVGDHVTYVLGHRSYAQYVAVAAWKVVPVPTDISADIACALMVNGLTAYYLSHQLFPLQTGQTCLIHAGAGAVGQLLIQLAHLRGARVITTVGSVEKRSVVQALGVRETLLYREVDFVGAVLAATGGRGVDVVYDSVGLETYRKSMKCLRNRGVCSLYGAASGVPDCVRPMEDLAENGSIFVTRSHLAHYMTGREDIEQACSVLFEARRSNRLSVAIDPARLSLAQAADAHLKIESRAARGKILLRVP